MIQHRKNLRLPGYDYSSEGTYFITIVTRNRAPLFGEIVNGEMVLNKMGEVVQFTWNDLINHNANIGLDEFVIMPNHIHGIVIIYDPVGAGSVVFTPVREFCATGKPTQIASGLEPMKHGVGLEPMKHGVGLEPTPTRKTSLSEIVRQLKTFSAKRVNQFRKTPGVPVWQRNYYDHIIGSDKEYEAIAEYIANNPINWLTDEER